MARQKQYIGVRQRSDGRFEKRFTMDGKQYSVYGASAKDCLDREITRRQEIAAGTYKANNVITLDEYFKEWTAGRRTSIKPATEYQVTRTYNKNISPVFGKRKIKDIERREIIQFQGELAKIMKFSSVNGTVGVLRNILQSSLIDQIITKNPCDGIKRVKRQEETKEARDTIHRALTDNELTLFMSYAKSTWNYELFEFLLNTGCRAGEACSLKWADIDFRKKVIHITKTTTHSRDGKIAEGKPKTDKSVRDIPLTDKTIEILNRQKIKMNAVYGNKIVQFDALVFKTIYNRHSSADSLDLSIKQIIRAIEDDGKHIDHFSAHAFRDTFATMAYENGMKPNTLKEILGHSSLAMTMDLYCHTMEETKEREMQLVSISY